MMVPLPPLRLAPPMMTAAKTGNVCDRPLSGWLVWMKEKSRMPAIAARIEHRMKAMTL